jgi:hypothetical protein
MNFTLQPGEVQINTWTLFYLPPGGGRFNGRLTVTDRRLLYDAKYDASLKGLLAEALLAKWGGEGYLEIDKSQIQSVAVQKRLLSKKCIVTMTDGSEHTFDYGAMNIDKAAAAIEAN